MAYLSDEEINAVREKADIAEVIGHYLQLYKNGKNIKAVCPFHDDHDPSMTINRERQIYKCFVCGAGGNVFGFVRDYEKISFPEAVVKVADMVGFPLSVKVTAKTESDPYKKALYDVLNETIRYTMYELNGEAASQEKAYLEKRGFDEAILRSFQIGYNPLSDKLYAFLKAKGYSDADMVSANVTRLTDYGMKDVFSGRITFPIHDMYGNPVGFSARSIDPEAVSKYINTTETELYVKGNLVYNAHRAKDSARRIGKIYICEGVTDVIAFARAGIDNAVCTLGTACTQEQLNLIRRLSPHAVFCYDGDQAGQHATMRAVQLAITAGLKVSVIDNKTGKDPDEIVTQDGREALQNLLKKEITWMEFRLQYESERTNMNSYLEKREFTEKAKQWIDRLEDEMDRKYFLERLSDISGIQIDYRRKSHTPQIYKDHNIEKKVPVGKDEAEETILILMMRYPSAVRVFEDELGYLTDENRQTLAMMIVEDVHRRGTADPVDMMNRCEDQSIQRLIASLLSNPNYELEYDEKVMTGLIRKVKLAYLQNEAADYKEQLQQTMNPKSRELISSKYTECITKLRRYIDEENNN